MGILDFLINRNKKDTDTPQTNLKTTEQTSYLNPIDGNTYTSEGGWKTYHPEKQRQEDGSNVETLQVILLSPGDVFEANTSTDSLTDFINEAGNKVKQIFSNSEISFELLLEFKIEQKERHTVKIATNNAVSNDVLQALYDVLISMNTIYSKSEPLSFQVHYAICKNDGRV